MSGPAAERPDDRLPTAEDFAGWPALGGLRARAVAGPVEFELERVDARVRDALASFDADAGERPRRRVRLEWTRAERPAWLSLRRGDRARSACWVEGGALAWATHHAALLMDTAAERGIVVLTDQDAAECARSAQNVLRVATAWSAAAAGAGLLLHAAAVMHQESAVLLLGPSGAGKSTAARLSAPRRILADDACVVSADADGARLHPVPFWADPSVASPLPGRLIPVRAVLRLRQGAAAACRSMTRPAAAASLLAHAPFVAGLGPAEAAARLAEAVSRAAVVAELEFALDPAFWTTIEEHLGRGGAPAAPEGSDS